MNCLDIITRAMRRIGVLAAGQLPTDDETEDALEALKAIFLRAVSEGALGELSDVLAETGDFEAEEFTRVFRYDAETTSITLPEIVTDDCTGEARAPRDKAVIAIADQFTASTVTYIYDGDEKQWLPVETMTATSKAPLASRDVTGIAAYLAVELADEYGQPLGEATVMAAQRWHSNIINGWSREMPTVARPENYF